MSCAVRKRRVCVFMFGLFAIAQLDSNTTKDNASNWQDLRKRNQKWVKFKIFNHELHERHEKGFHFEGFVCFVVEMLNSQPLTTDHRRQTTRKFYNTEMHRVLAQSHTELVHLPL